MSRSEQKKVNIVIGEAVLSLLDDFIDIRKSSIIERLEKMLKAETDDARRRIINDAIQQTRKTADSECHSGFAPAEREKSSECIP